MTKNKRSFRIRDSTTVHESLELCLQFQQMIEDKCLELGLLPSDLPNSIIPTSALYDIVTSYNAMYDKLLAEDLIYTGNSFKINKTTH